MPLHPALEGLGVFAGATVLGDGVVSLILDMEGISRKAGATQVVQATPTVAPPKAAEGGLVLVFEDTAGGRYGAPLETIQRVARFEAGQVQQVGGRSSLVLPDGIRASDDPLLSARSAAYSESFNRRTREQAAMPAKEPQP